jgi:tetratricopeptide (TPR) repeat protein
MTRNHFLAIALVLLPSFASQATEQKKQAQDPRPSACSAGEAWESDENIPPRWRKHFRESMARAGATASDVRVVWNLRKKSGGKNTLFLGQWLGSLLLKAGLPLEAFAIYQENILKNPEDPNHAGLWENISCLGEIRKKFPSLEISPALQHTLLKLAPAAKAGKEARGFQNALFLAGLDSLSRAEANPKPQGTVSALEGAGISQGVLKALQAASGSGTEALPVLHSIDSEVPHLPFPLANSLRMLAGQLHYTKGEFEEALRSWNQVSQESNQFAEALRGISWAQLSLERHSNAVGSAYNLLVGPLQRTFHPDAYLIIAIALNETCDFPRSMETIKAFKRAYRGSYAWLSAWQKRRPALYPQLAGFLRGDAGVPRYIGLEWARSPFFLSRQDEINELLLEREQLGEFHRKAAKDKAFQEYLTSRRDAGARRERQLVKAVGSALEEDAKRMLGSIVKVAEEMQLVRAEVLSNVGEKMIKDNAGAGPAPGKDSGEKGAGAPNNVWDWGNYTAATDETGETWSDELGFLKAEVKNLCIK